MSGVLDFSGKTIAVSGVASKIGMAIAEAFCGLGGRVFGADLAKPPAGLLPSGADCRDMDLTDRENARRWICDIEQQTGAPVSILVNSAGGVAGQSNQPLEDVADADWDRILDINLSVPFVLSRACAAGMKRAGQGVILNIGSGASVKASFTGIQAYCAAKHGLLGLTRQLAHELGSFGIRVNCVAPGFIVTNPSTARQWDALGEAGQKTFLQSIAMRRLGTPTDIANAVVMLSSDYAGFINGQFLQVDGGK
jgi:3-oxoacyl-[acyl-carrier protein] reductase